jgi:hypothetical protein
MNTSWISAPDLFHAVGVAIRVDLIGPMLAAISQPPSVFRPIDTAIGGWAKRSGLEIAYTWPSLIDHTDVMPANGQPCEVSRTAWRTGTRKLWSNSTAKLVLTEVGVDGSSRAVASDTLCRR